MDKEKLTINRLQEINKIRCEKHFRPLKNWLLSQYGNALAGETGETGEFCNIVKKMERDASSGLTPKDAGKELADIICYACLCASWLDLDLEKCVIEKFNEVSGRVGPECRIRL